MISSTIVFDMDGLLLDTERVCRDAFIDTRRAFSLPDSPEVFLKCVGHRQVDSDIIIRDSLENSADFEAFNAMWTANNDARLRREIPLKHGALQLLQILAAKGCSMAVATSTKTATARAHLEQAGMLRFITDVVGGDQVETGKPDPEVYHKAAALLAVDASDCVAFEDSETGTRAAVASGARTVQVPDLIPPSPAFAEHGQIIAPDLLEGAVMVGLLSRGDIPAL
ncbi:HAD superfamily hydrolase (TIGR01509 family) [Sulfitobacter undariae]|uniref:HAD superfamily hydrolase (TIGR01509 family) n=1 Tax=Sulfitobacter undariae TaxID=1563671 RepID=A0A7W6GZI6_9RHOB|nr:HAD family phosphatase [Sulfitobacter undariae]MBB3993575.1 HAD superfamily hydrolase (TIGR01509 family) [Sulfitobacter undariae]